MHSVFKFGFRTWLCLLVVALYGAPAHAVLTIEITKGADTGIPIAVVPFGWKGQGRPPHAVGEIIQADLLRSGRFTAIPQKDFVSHPQDDKDVVFKDWRIVKAEALVIGSVTAAGPGRYQVQFRLYDVFKQAQLAGFRYTVAADTLRAVAHQIADVVYEKLTGEPGAFNTRIAYITKEGVNTSVYKLQVADADGYNPRTVVRSTEPLLSPAWSPDGKRMLLALSKDGNAEIYMYTLGTREIRRLTYDGAIDTEPAWAPDGRSLVFTSDRAGRPQLYRMSVDGGAAQRLTFEGDYNARASFAPDGKMLTLVSGDRGRFHIATLKLDDGTLNVLTETPLDESPTFAPNGRMILYASELRGRGVLASVSADGRVRQLFREEQGDVREPAWSPYNRELQYKE